MKYLLANKKSYTSARILATNLGLKVTSDPEVILRNKGVLALRYGCSTEFLDDESDIFNTPQSIRNVSDSLRFQEICNKLNYNTPKYISPASIMLDTLTFPVLLRNRYHTRGLDIVFVNDLESLKRMHIINKYIVPFIDVDSEVGVHVINGEVVKIFKKVPVNENSHTFIRNIDHGYHFKAVNNLEDNFRLLQNIVIEMFKNLGLMFGRADVGYNSSKKDYVIWEINSAPGLNTHTAQLYAEKLLGLIK